MKDFIDTVMIEVNRHASWCQKHRHSLANNQRMRVIDLNPPPTLQ